MRVNTNRNNKYVRLTKSETDRLSEAGYILGHLQRELSALDLADRAAIAAMGGAVSVLETAASEYGWKEKVTA